MARWQPIPDGLEAQLRELVLRTRGAGDRPPRQMVASRGALAGGDTLRLVELWETAARGTGVELVKGRTGICEPFVGYEDFTAPLVSERRSRQRRALLAAAVAIVVLGGGMASGYALMPGAQRDGVGPQAGELPGFPCHDKVQDGRHYAGYAQTSTDVVGEGADGPQVTEIQCLLQRQRVDTGTVNGHFGRRTADAVKEYQRAHRLPVDGVVGKDTWARLRG